MKLQSREQTILGVGAIIGVVIIGWMGIGDIGISPQISKIMEVQSQLSTTNATIKNNEDKLKSLNQQKQQLEGTRAEMPPGKTLQEVKSGETLESTKLSMITSIIDMAESSFGNTLIYVKPLAPPENIADQAAAIIQPPPDGSAQPPADASGQPGIPGLPTNQPPQITFSDTVEVLPYEIAMRGTYSSISEFVKKLATSDTIIEVSQVDMVPEESADKALTDPSKPIKATIAISCMIKKM